MKRLLIACSMLLLLTACGTGHHAAPGDAPAGRLQPDHSHPAHSGGNVVEHEPVGYCGNTVTTVRYAPMGGQESWQKSFWGGTSVGLSDFLRWLDYSGDVCRCRPEYYVKTEFFKSEYGINLTEGYVRFEGGQTQLTEEQLEYLKQTIADVAADEGEIRSICGYPPAEERPLF